MDFYHILLQYCNMDKSDNKNYLARFFFGNCMAVTTRAANTNTAFEKHAYLK